MATTKAAAADSAPPQEKRQTVRDGKVFVETWAKISEEPQTLDTKAVELIIPSFVQTVDAAVSAAHGKPIDLGAIGQEFALAIVAKLRSAGCLAS